MPALNCIFHALVISRLLYALPAFSGFLSAASINRLDAACRKAKRWGITDLTISFRELIDQTDEDFFYKVNLSNHCLHHLLPPISPASQAYDLRPRGHQFSLPDSGTSLRKVFSSVVCININNLSSLGWVNELFIFIFIFIFFIFTFTFSF